MLHHIQNMQFRLQRHSHPWVLRLWCKSSTLSYEVARSWSTARDLLSRHLKNDHIHQMCVHVLYLLTSQTLEVLSMEQEARKSPHECHEQPHTAWVWSVKVRTHSALEKSQIFTVPSPDEVARRAPLRSTCNDGLSWSITFHFSRVINIQVHEL